MVTRQFSVERYVIYLRVATIEKVAGQQQGGVIECHSPDGLIEPGQVERHKVETSALRVNQLFSSVLKLSFKCQAGLVVVYCLARLSRSTSVLLRLVLQLSLM